MNSETWGKIKEQFGRALDALLAGINKLMQKTGEGLNMARLHREKSRLEGDIRKNKNEIGCIVYRKITEENMTDFPQQLGIEEKLNTITQIQKNLTEIEKEIAEEKKKADVKKPKKKDLAQEKMEKEKRPEESEV